MCSVFDNVFVSGGMVGDCNDGVVFVCGVLLGWFQDVCVVFLVGVVVQFIWSVWVIGYGGLLCVGGDVVMGLYEIMSCVVGVVVGVIYDVLFVSCVGFVFGGVGVSYVFV